MKINVDKPLQQRLILSAAGGGASGVEVTFRYERLLTFCLSCGRIRHGERFYPGAFDEEDGKAKQNYSPEI